MVVVSSRWSHAFLMMARPEPGAASLYVVILSKSMYLYSED